MGTTRAQHPGAGVWVGHSQGAQPWRSWSRNNLVAAVSSHRSLFSPGRVTVPRPLGVRTMIFLKTTNIEGGWRVYLQDLSESDRESVHSAPISWPTCPPCYAWRTGRSSWPPTLTRNLHHASMPAYPLGSGQDVVDASQYWCQHQRTICQQWLIHWWFQTTSKGNWKKGG